MRKQILLFLLPFLFITLFACGKDTTGDSQTPHTTTETETSETIIGGEIQQDPSHVHSFSAATCTEAAKCSCGMVKGKPKGHQFNPATCTNPKICKVCGATSGSPKHNYDSDNDIACNRCKKITRLSYESMEDGVRITGCKFKNLASLELPTKIEKKEVIEIGDGAFQDCTKLKSVKLPDSVEKIGESAFAGCSALKSITLSKNLKSIGKSAFSHCSALKEIEILGEVSVIEAETFWNCSKLKKITLPENLVSIEESAFRYCDELQRVKLPQGFESIGDRAFANCTALNVVIVPKSLSYVGNWAFSGCLYLRDVFYEGSKKNQEKIDVLMLNEQLLNAIWHYNTDIAEMS